MKHRYTLVFMFLAATGAAPIAWAQTTAHKMVMPDDLKWTDVAALPSGAKVAMLEGKLEEAAPFECLTTLRHHRLKPRLRSGWLAGSWLHWQA